MLIDLQDNLYTMGELTNDEGKKIVSEMSKLLNKLYDIHADDFNPTQEMPKEEMGVFEKLGRF